jgi:hypothetical protein
VNRFATFGALYMTALFLEPAEHWRDPMFTAGLILLGVVLLATGLTRSKLALFLLVATAHTLWAQFPDVANHVNVELYVNLLLLVAIGYSFTRRAEHPSDDDCFELVRPILQASLVVVYAMAGFDKLNHDFLDPQVSCVGTLMGDLARVGRGHTLGVPTPILLVAGVGLVPAGLATTAGPSRAPGWLRRLGAFLLVLLPTTLVLRLALGFQLDTAVMALGAMAGVVICWELIGGLLLLAPRWQGPCLLFSWAMHAMLSLIGFVDFGSLAFALLFTFVPVAYLDLMTGSLRLPIVRWTVPRAHAYVGLNIVAGVASGMHRRLVAAVIFNAAALIVLWPMLRALAAQVPRVVWPGVALRSRLTPGWLYLFPVLLLGHGLTSYFGLRTAGNFSMFSNLRTEGPRSNHLLLAANPLKLWSYQEDVVRFARIDDQAAAVGYNYQPLQGQALPVVEFRKLIYAWTRADRVVPVAFEYRGRLYATDDIVHDPVWRTRGRDWEMRLLDFRVIQPEGANRCRW